MGPRLQGKRRSSFLKNVVCAFAAALWLDGCPAPQVKGYQAHLHLKPDARAKVIQPFPLSEFDRMRLEYHEDLEVAQGKAMWSLPGDTCN